MARKVTDPTSTWQEATTIPGSIDGLGADDPRRSWDGPAAEGVIQLRNYLMLELGSYKLFLSPVGDEQAQRTSRDRFNGEAEYNERVADVFQTFAKVLPKYAFTAGNIQKRLARCKSLNEIIIVVAGLLNRLQRSAHLEWSNLTRLSDAVVTDIELQLQRPVLDPELRQQLTEAAGLPLATWQARQAQTARQRSENESLRSDARDEMQAELAAANARADQAERRLKELEDRLAAAAIGASPAAVKNLPRPQPSRRSRKRQ